MKWRELLLFIAGIISLAACQPPDQNLDVSSHNASLTLKPCTQEQFSHLGNRKDFQCGKLAVLENPNDSASHTIDLNIVRLPALSSSPQGDPVFVLAGGPGQGSTEIVASVTPWMTKVNRERDIIFVDQRGTGQSDPLDCGEDSLPDLTLTAVEQEQRLHRQLRDCLEGYAADLRFYTTPYAADDINAVREALGYSQVNLWGASYGTRFALEIMRRHPNVVRSAVLDSVAPIGINLPQHMLRDADSAMQHIIELCEGQQACANKFPRLGDTLAALIRKYDQQPTMVSLTHPLRGDDFKLRLDGQTIASLLRLGLYVRDIAPTLPLMIDEAAEGEFGPLMTLLSLSEEINGGISLGLHYTILCAEDVASISQTDTQRDSLLQLKTIEPIKKVCAFWPRGELPEDFFKPVQSEIPTLLLSGELDPVTPPSWGEAAASHLSRHKHLMVSGAHHGVSHLGCVPDIIATFYENLQTENIDDNCIRSIEPLPPFVTVAGPAMLSEQETMDKEE